MVGYGIIYGLMIIGISVLSSARILPPLKVDPSSLHLYKTGLRNELDYIMKRNAAVQNVEDIPDSKERRSQMGSSFIRFGRNRLEKNQENPDYSVNSFNEIDSSASRIPRGRSDVIIRFGRAGSPGSYDLTGARGKIFKLLPIELEQLALLCPDILVAADSGVSNELAHICASIERESNQVDKSNA